MLEGGRRRDGRMADLSLSIMPLSFLRVSAHHGDMRIRQQFQMVAHDPARRGREIIARERRTAKVRDGSWSDRGEARSTMLLIRDPTNPEHLVPRPSQIWLRLLAHMFASSLDRRLASGCSPESSPLLATRAQRLVSSSMRRALAHNWLDLMNVVRRPPVARSPHTPLCRDRIIAAEDDIRAMLEALSTALPTPAHGVAMASWLLRNGAGPLYNRHCAVDLGAELREATAQLDPGVSLAGVA